MLSIFQAAERCLQEISLAKKLSLTRQYAEQWRAGALSWDNHIAVLPIAIPGRPARPELVAPALVPRRGLGSIEGRAALVHAVTHIEFNAINLAWDAVYRFRDHPREFVDDWVLVADEEAYHFQLLQQRLSQLGYQYGDFPAHDGLWEMACKTDNDPMVRMALVPRVLEARGLDVTPPMIRKLKQIGDHETVALLEIIFRDEIGHVAIGSRWFKYHCQLRGLDWEKTFRELVTQYYVGALRGPFDYQARIAAGFSELELQQLERLIAETKPA